ncbi:hypothetical protein Ahy_A06g027776 isoform A [Arachis hypogaea]|uniref:Uncharacterized protein n=1 Tax=Arachis hypogaea TaxID=3818 RepID=A0A445CPT9_ARAHY|nr:hypothetical protein Ahy_A06g027776 isoform A [Arachis hypogaea]
MHIVYGKCEEFVVVCIHYGVCVWLRVAKSRDISNIISLTSLMDKCLYYLNDNAFNLQEVLTFPQSN